MQSITSKAEGRRAPIHAVLDAHTVLRFDVIMEVLAVLLYTIIHQVHEGIFQRFPRVREFVGGEPRVALVIEIDREGVPVRHEDPLPQVELSLGNEQLRLHIFLHDPERARPARLRVAVVQ